VERARHRRRRRVLKRQRRAARPGALQHNTARSRAEKKPSAAGKVGSGDTPYYDNPTRTHAVERQAKKAKPSVAARSSAAEKGVRGSPPTTAIQLARTPKKVEPSASARPSAAEKGGSGFSPNLGLQLANAPKMPIAATPPSAA
jgi:hypothetical protein